MAFTFNVAEIKTIEADIQNGAVKLEELLPIVEKIASVLPLPASVKVGLTDLQSILAVAAAL